MNIRAAALNTPVSVMETAGEGGAWGMALLASYMVHKKDGETYVETECSHLLRVRSAFRAARLQCEE